MTDNTQDEEMAMARNHDEGATRRWLTVVTSVLALALVGACSGSSATSPDSSEPGAASTVNVKLQEFG